MKLISYIGEDVGGPFIIKPDTVMLRNNDPYYVPLFSKKISARLYVAAKITRVTKAIDIKFAGRCYEEVGVVIEMVATDVLDECRRQGLPWDKAVSYDKSTAVPNNFCSISEINPIFAFDINGSRIFEKKTDRITEIINAAVSASSYTVTLKIGDMVLVPLSVGSYGVNIGDFVTAYCGDIGMLDFEIK